MSVFIQFFIIGLASGAIYVLFAFGLVIIHRAAGIVNFAQGAVGMVGTFIAWKLMDSSGVPYWPAVIVGTICSGCIGLVIHVAIRFLRNSSMVTRTIATLAFVAILQESISLIYTGPPIVVKSGLPTGTVTILGATIGIDRVILLGTILVLAVGLTVAYQRTSFGRATAALTENRRALSALGWSPDKLAAANWTLGSALAGLAGVLLAPITGLSIIAFTLLVVPALGAAVVGRLTSFPLTLVGGLLIGVLQAEVERYVTAPGWSDAVPFLVMIAVLVVRGHERISRQQVAQRLPRLGTGRIRPALLVLWLVVTIGLINRSSPSWADAWTTTIGTALIVLSVVIVTGYSGQLSLAQFALAGFGAYVAAELAGSHGVPFLLAVLVASLVSATLGLLIGLICLRTRGVNLAIATLGLAVALDDLVFSNPQRTVAGSVVVPEPKVAGMDVGAILHPGRYAIVVIIAFTICAVATANLRRGTSGRRLVAVRSNERAASSLGINVVQAKVFAFALSSFVAAIGGCMLAFRYPSIGFADGAYSPLFSINMVMYAVVGGVGWVAGAVYGGLLQPGSLGARVLDLFGPNLKTYLPLAGGVLLLLTVASAPDGLAKQGMDHVSALFGRLRLRRSKPRDELLTDSDDHEVTQQSLTIENISVAFGGVQAVKSASLSVSPGEIVGLIGPNGAGKTTFIDAATGFVRASSGRVVLGDLDISRFSPVRRARVGLTRSFQSLELFDDLTVLDNLRAASDRRGLLAYLTDLIYPRVAPMTLAMRAAIREFELQEHLEKTPTELPYGVRRQVAIARAIASEASVVALDEPAAGLDNHEARELSALIRRLATNWGMGFLLVEHNVDVIMSVCDRVYVLNFGEIIAEGTPQEIRGNPAVISAYLGDEKSEIENVASSAMPLSLEPPSRAGGPARD